MSVHAVQLRKIIHIDMDFFYISVEERDHSTAMGAMCLPYRYVTEFYSVT